MYNSKAHFSETHIPEFVNNIRIEDFNYILPEERIAKYPLKERDKSKLLLFDGTSCSEHVFKDIVSFIQAGSLLVFNNTKVIHARILFKKETGAEIEVFCLEPSNPMDYNIAFQQKEKSTWNCFVGNLKRWKTGKLVKQFEYDGKVFQLSAEKKKNEGELVTIEFTWNAPLNFIDVLEITGIIPIPPYLNRDSEISDNVNYQTVYSKIEGSVAAPTAGLHFTNELLSQLNGKNIQRTELTLHVGAGTFKPVSKDHIYEHEMHTEHFEVTREAFESLRLHQENIIAVGTTSVRTIESLYWLGVKLKMNLISDEKEMHISQWEVYQTGKSISVNEALSALIDFIDLKNMNALKASTQIMIVPGYSFKLVKGIITNFHQPKSTLLLLIAAFINTKWKEVYEFALLNNFRFLSYGDSSLLLNQHATIEDNIIN